MFRATRWRSSRALFIRTTIGLVFFAATIGGPFLRGYVKRRRRGRPGRQIAPSARIARTPSSAFLQMPKAGRIDAKPSVYLRRALLACFRSGLRRPAPQRPPGVPWFPDLLSALWLLCSLESRFTVALLASNFVNSEAGLHAPPGRPTTRATTAAHVWAARFE